jgi:hypothetical protein
MSAAAARTWAAAFIPVAVFVALFAWGFVAIETAPRDDPSVLFTADTDGSPTLNDLGPAEEAAVPQPELPDAEPIEQMPVREGVSLNSYIQQHPDEVPVVADVAYLGTRDPYYAMALLSADAQVCLALMPLPESDPSLHGTTVCTSWEEYLASGLAIDMGGWELRYSVDGGAEWLGV